MCAVCRRRFPKAELLRHARGASGEWLPDFKYLQPGRGCYVCSAPACRERFAACGAKAEKRRAARAAARKSKGSAERGDV